MSRRYYNGAPETTRPGNGTWFSSSLEMARSYAAEYRNGVVWAVEVEDAELEAMGYSLTEVLRREEVQFSGAIASRASIQERVTESVRSQWLAYRTGATTASWYDRYRELKNRYDLGRESGQSLTPAEMAELDRLNARLLEESGMGSAAAQMDAAVGSGTVAEATLSGGSNTAASVVNRDNPLLDELFDPSPAGSSPAGGAGASGGGSAPPSEPPASGTNPNPSSGSSSPPGPPPGPPVGAGGPGASGPSDRVLGVLTEIRDALRTLVRQKESSSKKSGGGSGGLMKWLSLMDGALFGDSPRTAMGRFGHSMRRLGGRTFRQGRNAWAWYKGARAAGAAGGGAAASGAAAGATSAEAGITAGIGTTGATAGSAATGIGLIVAAGVIFTAAVAEFTKAAYEFARSQEDEIRRLGQVGGAQAGAAAQLDAERIKRDVETAGETGDSSVALIDKLNTFEEKLRPLESALTNIQNNLAGVFLESATSIVQMATPIVQAANAAIAWFTDQNLETELPEPMWDVMERMVKEQEKGEVPKWPVGPARTSEI